MENLSTLEREGVNLLMSLASELRCKNNLSTLNREGVFLLMSLPPELRCKIYYFAVVEPRPLPLITHRHRNRVNGYGVEKDLRMLGTCREFREEMSRLLYSENSFSYYLPQDEVEEEIETFRIDPRSIQKCHISLEQFGKEAIWVQFSLEDPDGIMVPLEEARLHYILGDLVNMLAFTSYKLKHLLIECKPQILCGLALALSPLYLLRNIEFVHFRSTQREMHQFFRLLEDLMTSNRPVPYSDFKIFWSEVTCQDSDLIYPYDSWFAKSLNGDSHPVTRSQEQNEAIAKEFYSILGMGRELRDLNATNLT